MTNGDMAGKWQKADTNFFMMAGWGVFIHYLAGGFEPGKTGADVSVDQWNVRVNQFDVEGFAQQVEAVGAGYCIITLGQNSGHYCSPNVAYDSLVGQNPSKCSKRDLIGDLYEALHPRGIHLMVYVCSGAPTEDTVAVEKLQWRWGNVGQWGDSAGSDQRTGERLVGFQLKWETVIREWSLRWGGKVAGWWVDGCYFSDAMYRYTDPPNFASFAAAMKAGNPHSIVAFNPGVKTPVISLTEYEDYTAGEISEVFPICPGRWIDGTQYHILSYLGETWGKGQPRFIDEFVLGYTKEVTVKSGVVSWDVPVNYYGLISEPFLRQLTGLKKSIK